MASRREKSCTQTVEFSCQGDMARLSLFNEVDMMHGRTTGRARLGRANRRLPGGAGVCMLLRQIRLERILYWAGLVDSSCTHDMETEESQTWLWFQNSTHTNCKT